MSQLLVLKLGQFGNKWDKSDTFKGQFSVYFGSQKHDLKIPRRAPIGANCRQHLTSLNRDRETHDTHRYDVITRLDNTDNS